MDWVANIIVVFGAVSFLALGGYMAWGGDRTASATAVLTVACFLVLLLFVSKFKHVKGFGFEGELWEQEQVKAAELRKSLSAISESLSQQIALIASRVGYWNSTLSVEELLGVIDSNTEWLSTIGRNREKRDEILAPLYSKVEQYYWNDARELVAKTLSDQQNILQDKINRSPADPPAEREVLRRQLDAINAASERARKFTLDTFREARRLTFLIDILNQNRALLPEAETYLRRLSDLNEDIVFFVQNRKARSR